MSAQGAPRARRLTEANQEAHFLLEDLYLDFMEALLEVDYEAAHLQLARLTGAIEAHAALEDVNAIPRFAHWLEGRTEAQARTVSSLEGEIVVTEKTDLHLAGDHKILLRGLAAAARQLLALTEKQAPRRQLASVLEPFVRFQSVLEHHTVREQRFLYPVLDTILESEEAAALADSLIATVKAGSKIEVPPS